MGCFDSSTYQTEVVSMPDENTPTTPVRKRKQQDVFFLVLFMAMVNGMGYLTSYSVMRGDPYRYSNGVDSWGNVCGRKNNLAISGVKYSGIDHGNRKFEFHMGLNDIKTALNPLSYIMNHSRSAVICVSECPAKIMKCKQLLTDNGYNLNQTLVDKRVCTMPYGVILPHTYLINRCIPSQLVTLASTVAEATSEVIGSGNSNQSATTNAPSNVTNSPNDWMSSLSVSVSSFTRYVLTSMTKYGKDTIYLTLIALAICFFVLLLLQLFTRVLLIFIIVVGGIGSILLTAFLWYNYAVVQGYVNEIVVAQSVSSLVSSVESLSDVVQSAVENIASSSNGNTTANSNKEVSNYVENELNVTGVNVSTVDVTGLLDSIAFSAVRDSQALLPVTIGVTILTTISLILLIWLRHSLCLVVNLFDEACKAVLNMPVILFQPVLTLIFMGLVCAYFFIVSAFILSIQVPAVDNDGLVSYFRKNDTPLVGLIGPHIFGCLWMLEFISGCQQMVLAGAVCRWFFSHQEEKKWYKSFQICPTVRPAIDMIFYNLGTVAFGSLIIAIVQFVRIILAYLQRKLKGKETKSAEFIMKCMACCLACFEKVLKYINRNAYICSAMYGDGFCKSGKRALMLLIANAQHMMALNCVGGFCLFLGKLTVVTISAITCIIWFKMKLGSKAKATEYLVPTVTVSIGAYFIARCFFHVYGLAIDTIFLCFCDDQERNNGEDRPYYSSVALQKFMSGSSSHGSKKKKPSSFEDSGDIPKESARRFELEQDELKVPDIEKIVKLQRVPRPRGAKGNRRAINNKSDNIFSLTVSFAADVKSCNSSDTNSIKSDTYSASSYNSSDKSLPIQQIQAIRLPQIPHKWPRLENDNYRERRRTPTPFPPTTHNGHKSHSKSVVTIPGQIPDEEDGNKDIENAFYEVHFNEPASPVLQQPPNFPSDQGDVLTTVDETSNSFVASAAASNAGSLSSDATIDLSFSRSPTPNDKRTNITSTLGHLV